MRFTHYILLAILFFSCGEIVEQRQLNTLEPFEEVLSGKLIGGKIQSHNKRINSDFYDVTIYTQNSQSELIELDIHFTNTSNKTYSELRNYYNSKFQTSQTDSVFNTWKSNSKEFILYKNSDSSILVNIYKRK